MGINDGAGTPADILTERLLRETRYRRRAVVCRYRWAQRRRQVHLGRGSFYAARQPRPRNRILDVIEGDQFYAGGTAETWDRRTPCDNAQRVVDWRRQRMVLTQLRTRGVAQWYPFDWESHAWDHDSAPLKADPVVAHARSVVVLEGAYSCRPELHDLLDLRVLLDAAPDIRRNASTNAKERPTEPTGKHAGPPPRTTTSRP